MTGPSHKAIHNLLDEVESVAVARGLTFRGLKKAGRSDESWYDGQFISSPPDAATVAEPTTPVGFWHPGPGPAGYYPYIAANLDATIAHDPTNSWAVRPGEVALEASQSGQFAAVQFTIPHAGSYAIAADFAGIHKGLSTTDVHVLLDDESLFTAIIAGYGGDPAFYPRQGQSPTASYRATRALRAGDVLTFAIGFGTNRTHYGDTTGLTVTIRTGP